MCDGALIVYDVTRYVELKKPAEQFVSDMMRWLTTTRCRTRTQIDTCIVLVGNKVEMLSETQRRTWNKIAKASD